jgi:hypothetical protein
MEKDLEENIAGQFELIPRNLPGGTEETHTGTLNQICS